MIMEWMSILNKNILLHKIDVSVNIHFALDNYDNVDLCFARSKSTVELSSIIKKPCGCVSNMNTKRLMQYQKHTVHETMWMSVHHELKMININFKNLQSSSIVTMWMSVHHEL